jgi:hypothetical protein
MFGRRRRSRATGQTVICLYSGDRADVTKVTQLDRDGNPFVTFHAWCPSCGNDFDVTQT